MPIIPLGGPKLCLQTHAESMPLILCPPRSKGGAKYQEAFYVFEELAQAPSTSSVQTLVAQAVSELHLGRTEEAQAALNQALEKDPSYVAAIANALVLQVIIGKDPKEQIE